MSNLADMLAGDDTTIVPEETPETAQAEGEAQAEPEAKAEEEAKPEAAPELQAVGEPTLKQPEPVKVEDSREFKGLLGETQREREARQRAERERDELKAQLDARAQADAQRAAPQSQVDAFWKSLAESGRDENDTLTIAEQRALLAAQRADSDAVASQRSQESAAERWEEFKAAVDEVGLAKYTSESAGEGLDYRTVLTTGGPNLTAGDRFDIAYAQDRNGVARARTPQEAAEIAYKRAIQRTPELEERYDDARLTRRVKAKVTTGAPATGGQPKTKPKVPSGVSASDVISAPHGYQDIASWMAEG